MFEMKESFGRQTHLQPQPIPTQNVGKTPVGFNEHGIKTLDLLFRFQIMLLDVKLLLGEKCSFNVQTFSKAMSRRALLWIKLLRAFFFLGHKILSMEIVQTFYVCIYTHAEWVQLHGLQLAVIVSSFTTHMFFA